MIAAALPGFVYSALVSPVGECSSLPLSSLQGGKAALQWVKSAAGFVLRFVRLGDGNAKGKGMNVFGFLYLGGSDSVNAGARNLPPSGIGGGFVRAAYPLQNTC
jgi:hypothetical protein